VNDRSSCSRSRSETTRQAEIIAQHPGVAVVAIREAERSVRRVVDEVAVQLRLLTWTEGAPLLPSTASREPSRVKVLLSEIMAKVAS